MVVFVELLSETVVGVMLVVVGVFEALCVPVATDCVFVVFVPAVVFTRSGGEIVVVAVSLVICVAVFVAVVVETVVGTAFVVISATAVLIWLVASD